MKSKVSGPYRTKINRNPTFLNSGKRHSRLHEKCGKRIEAGFVVVFETPVLLQLLNQHVFKSEDVRLET